MDDNECKVADEWSGNVDDYMIYKHKRYGRTLYTYIGQITDIWFPNCINGASRYITIKLLYTDDKWLDVPTENDNTISINISRINSTPNDVFAIITREEALAKVL